MSINPVIACSLVITALPSTQGACRRKVEMTPGAQSRNDTPIGGGQDQRDTGSQPNAGIGIKLLLLVTGEAEAGSAGEQPAEE